MSILWITVLMHPHCRLMLCQHSPHQEAQRRSSNGQCSHPQGQQRRRRPPQIPPHSTLLRCGHNSPDDPPTTVKVCNLEEDNYKLVTSCHIPSTLHSNNQQPAHAIGQRGRLARLTWMLSTRQMDSVLGHNNHDTT